MKKILSLFFVLLFVFACGKGDPCTPGAEGPSGGYIFFCDDPDNKLLPAGKLGLEIASAETDQELQWDPTQTLIGVTESGIGDGQENTESIVDVLGPGTNYAAGYCDSLDENGYSDWFLPSKEELEKIYSVLFIEHEKGELKNGVYWSSSEDSGTHSWMSSFNFGDQNPSSKTNHQDVRCIRAF